MRETRPNDVGVWIRLADMLDAPDDRAEGLAAADRALALDPRNLEAHGKRVYLLAISERYDEALAACRPDVFGAAPPLELRARAAGIEAQRGNLALAIERMRQVLADDSNYFWGWSRVADWTEQAEDNAAYLEAAENMVRIQPQEALSWGYRGDARQRTGDRAGAKQDLQRAAQLAPSYVYAGMSLFRMCSEDGEFEEAEAALDKVAAHMPDDYVFAERIRLDCAER